LSAPDVVLIEDDLAADRGAVAESDEIRDRSVVLGGYVETEYHDGFDDQPSYFDQHRMVLYLYAQPHQRVRFATEIEWEHGGVPRKRNGELGVGEVLLEFATLDFEIARWWQARAGILLVPIGAYNVLHDAPTQDITTRPLVSTYVAPSTWYESGAGFFGELEPGGTLLSYEAYAINGLDTKLYDGLGARAARGSLAEDNNQNKAAVGRVEWQPLTGLKVGLSGYHGAYDPGGTRYVDMGAWDLAARLGPVEVQGEGVRAWIDPGFDEGWANATRNPVPEGMGGVYGQLNAHLRLAPLNAALPADLADLHFTGVLRYEEVDTDRAVVSDGDRIRTIVGLNIRPIEALVFKNELLLDTDGASGEVARPFSGGYAPNLGYAGSVALLF
jgi:hypothetical protein